MRTSRRAAAAFGAALLASGLTVVSPTSHHVRQCR